MIKIGDKIKLECIAKNNSITNKMEWREFTGKVIALTRYAIVLQKETGIKESFNFSQLTDKNIKVMKRINKSYEVLSYQDILKQFGRSKL